MIKHTQKQGVKEIWIHVFEFELESLNLIVYQVCIFTGNQIDFNSSKTVNGEKFIIFSNKINENTTTIK